jgi:hypothetical protein
MPGVVDKKKGVSKNAYRRAKKKAAKREVRAHEALSLQLCYLMNRRHPRKLVLLGAKAKRLRPAKPAPTPRVPLAINMLIL